MAIVKNSEQNGEKVDRRRKLLDNGEPNPNYTERRRRTADEKLAAVATALTAFIPSQQAFEEWGDDAIIALVKSAMAHKATTDKAVFEQASKRLQEAQA